MKMESLKRVMNVWATRRLTCLFFFIGTNFLYRKLSILNCHRSIQNIRVLVYRLRSLSCVTWTLCDTKVPKTAIYISRWIAFLLRDTQNRFTESYMEMRLLQLRIDESISNIVHPHINLIDLYHTTSNNYECYFEIK